MRLVLAAAALLAAVLAGCADEHAVFGPEGPVADRIATLGWVMVITASAIAVLFLGMLVFGLFRRRRDRPFRLSESTWIVAGGVVMPAIVVLTVAGLSIDVLNEPAGGTVRIEVVGHQYWWEVRYPDEGLTTANELHIPTNEAVEVTLRSDDVIHSFWLPDLAGKIDLVPGRTNRLVFEADEPGTYRGQCAEYCGLAHAQMAFYVTAEPRDDFEAWVGDTVDEADPPSTPREQAGLEAFLRLPCAACHTIRGTEAEGKLGPELTHFASRESIGAGAVRNTRGNLAGWMPNSQTLKPGNLMPPVPMSPEELQALLAYVGSLE